MSDDIKIKNNILYSNILKLANEGKSLNVIRKTLHISWSTAKRICEENLIKIKTHILVKNNISKYI